MIVVTGSQRTGTALAMQILEAAGANPLKQEPRPEMGQFNPKGYYDPPGDISEDRLRHLGPNDCVKLLPYNLKKLMSLEIVMTEPRLICIRHPMVASASYKGLRDHKQDLGNAGRTTISKAVRIYVDNFTYLISNGLHKDAAILRYEDYKEKVERIVASINTITKLEITVGLVQTVFDQSLNLSSHPDEWKDHKEKILGCGYYSEALRIYEKLTQG